MKSNNQATTNERIAYVIQQIIQENGKFPNRTRLEELADYLLLDDLSNQSSDKVSNTEYPILSEKQLIRRRMRELALENDWIDGLYFKRMNHVKRNSKSHK